MNSGLAAFALLAYLAYLASRILARRHLPELVGFLVVGALLGPSVLGLVDAEDLSRFQPLTEIALAILMFVIGERISTRALRAARWAVSAGVVQFVFTALAMFWATRGLGASRPVALVLATLAGAGAPATVSHVVTSLRAVGTYPQGLIGTHAVADALTVVAFAAVLPAASLLTAEEPDVAGAVTDFLQLGLGGFAMGLAGGFLISRVGRQIETSGELLLFVLIHLLMGWAVTEVVDVSLPLAALVAGATAATTSPTDFSQRLFRAVRSIEQPVYLLFFALAGAGIHLEDIPEVGVLGVTYIVVRTAMKVVGGFVGGVIGGLKARESFRLGIDLIPQAGVAVGLAALAAETLGDDGGEAATIVLGSVVLFELVGPVLVARGLTRPAGAPSGDGSEPAEPAPTEVLDLEHVPSKVLAASPVPVTVPEWLVQACGRWHAELIVLQPVEADDDQLAGLRRRAEAAMVELRVRTLRQESFTGSVVRLANETSSELLVLFAPRPAEPYAASRLVLLPAERIARELTVPVLTFPLPPVTGIEQPSSRTPWWRSRR